MTKSTHNIRNIALAATLGLGIFSSLSYAETATSSVKLLTANFETRNVVQIEAGDFHFTPGQVAPLHTHEAPAVGYVAKGSIIYQVEGEKVHILNEGDAFYEPTDKRILRFDNASATQEAIFIDFNFEEKGEPFIVFEEKPKGPIDRRTLPTVTLKGEKISQVNVYATELAKNANITLNNSEPTLGIVAEGVVEFHVEGKETLRLAAGKTFSLPAPNSKAKIVNASSEVSAKIITFKLK